MSVEQMSNAALPGELMAEVRKLAQAEERSTDEVVQEAVERYLQSRRLMELYAYGEERARRSGITEADVPAVVEQWRKEHPEGRGR
jgi:metal-responsive CopG/Arc/MetJ family transcriptional regulator